MKQYLLDTNICIYYLKGEFDLGKKIESVGEDNCFVSEITIAELKYGAMKSAKVERNLGVVSSFQRKFSVVPIFNSLDTYAKEKARLKTKGKSLDDFDLLIGSSAITNNLILVTRNTSDFDRMDGIILEDWTIKNVEQLGPSEI